MRYITRPCPGQMVSERLVGLSQSNIVSSRPCAGLSRTCGDIGSITLPLISGKPRANQCIISDYNQAWPIIGFLAGIERYVSTLPIRDAPSFKVNNLHPRSHKYSGSGTDRSENYQ